MEAIFYAQVVSGENLLLFWGCVMTNEQTAIMLEGHLAELEALWPKLKVLPVVMPTDGEVHGAQEIYDGIKRHMERLHNQIVILKGGGVPFSGAGSRS